MSDQSFPLNPTTITSRRPSTRTNITLGKLMDDPVVRSTMPVGTDGAWALKLKTCVDTVVRDLRIDVLAAKPVLCYGSQDPRDMLFEVVTPRGPLEVLRNRSGEHIYHWKSEARG